MSLRDQFQATSTKKLKEVVEQENEIVASGNYSDYLVIDEGLNKLRLYPKHIGEESYAILRGSHWITVDKDGEEKRTTVPNAKVHGKCDKDVIEEYVAYVTRILGTGDAEDIEKVKALTDWKIGLGMQTSWLAYADKIKKDKKEFGLWEFKKQVRDGLNNEAIIEDESEAMETDPFTDPDTGKPILLTYNKKPNKKKGEVHYKVQLSKTSSPLTDEELEKFARVNPLSKLPMVQYSLTDFEKACEGLQHFDEAYEINLFETEEFQDIVEECKGMIASDEGVSNAATTKKTATKKTAAAAPAKKVAAKKVVVEEPIEDEVEAEEVEEDVVEEEAVEESDGLDDLDRDGLKAYIRDNKDTLTTEVKVFRTDTEETLREKIRAAMPQPEEAEPEAEEDEAPFEEEEVEETPPAPVKKAVPAKKVATITATAAGKKPTLEEIKASLAKNKAK